MATDNSRGTGSRAAGGRSRARPASATEAAHAEALKQLITDKVTEKVTRKMQAKADRQIEKLERASATIQARADEQVERVSDSIARTLGSQVPDALDLWTRTAPGSRRPRFTHEDIAEAGVHIADTEGIEALSMRRLAIELGAGTMTLYHYVRTKDELLALITDVVMGEIVLPPEAVATDDWKAAMTAVANSSRAALERHPWIFDIVEDPATGPNGVRHFDQSLQAVASMPGTLADHLDVIFAVDEYVFGYCLHRRDDIHSGGHADAAMMRYVGGLVAQGGYPQLQALIAEHGLEQAWTVVEEHGRDDTRFDRNLARLLDGIERSLT